MSALAGRPQLDRAADNPCACACHTGEPHRPNAHSSRRVRKWRCCAAAVVILDAEAQRSLDAERAEDAARKRRARGSRARSADESAERSADDDAPERPPSCKRCGLAGLGNVSRNADLCPACKRDDARARCTHAPPREACPVCGLGPARAAQARLGRFG